MKQTIISLTLLLCICLTSCKKNEVSAEPKLENGCVKIIKKIAPNKVAFINPDTNEEQTFEFGNTEWATYNVGDVICKSAYFNY